MFVLKHKRLIEFDHNSAVFILEAKWRGAAEERTVRTPNLQVSHLPYERPEV